MSSAASVPLNLSPDEGAWAEREFEAEMRKRGKAVMRMDYQQLHALAYGEPLARRFWGMLDKNYCETAFWARHRPDFLVVDAITGEVYKADIKAEPDRDLPQGQNQPNFSVEVMELLANAREQHYFKTDIRIIFWFRNKPPRWISALDLAKRPRRPCVYVNRDHASSVYTLEKLDRYASGWVELRNKNRNDAFVLVHPSIYNTFPVVDGFEVQP